MLFCRQTDMHNIILSPTRTCPLAHDSCKRSVGFLCVISPLSIYRINLNKSDLCVNKTKKMLVHIVCIRQNVSKKYFSTILVQDIIVQSYGPRGNPIPNLLPIPFWIISLILDFVRERPEKQFSKRSRNNTQLKTTIKNVCDKHKTF